MGGLPEQSVRGAAAWPVHFSAAILPPGVGPSEHERRSTARTPFSLESTHLAKPHKARCWQGRVAAQARTLPATAPPPRSSQGWPPSASHKLQVATGRRCTVPPWVHRIRTFTESQGRYPPVSTGHPGSANVKITPPPSHSALTPPRRRGLWPNFSSAHPLP